MTDERTKVFLLLDEAEKRQKTAEQQQAALKDLLQASRTAGNALDKAIAALPSTVQRAVDSAIPNAMATAMNRAAQTAYLPNVLYLQVITELLVPLRLLLLA